MELRCFPETHKRRRSEFRLKVWSQTVERSKTSEVFQQIIWHPSKVVDSCFGNGASLLSRNPHLAFVSGNPLRVMNETTVHYFYRDMKGANYF